MEHKIIEMEGYVLAMGAGCAYFEYRIDANRVAFTDKIQKAYVHTNIDSARTTASSLARDFKQSIRIIEVSRTYAHDDVAVMGANGVYARSTD